MAHMRAKVHDYQALRSGYMKASGRLQAANGV